MAVVRHGAVRVRCENVRHFTDTADLRCRWELAVDGSVVDGGELDVAPIPAGGATVVRVPVARRRLVGAVEAFLTLRWCQRRATPWAPVGHVVAHDQFPVRDERRLDDDVDAAGRGGGDGDRTAVAATTSSTDATSDATVTGVRRGSSDAPVELVWTPTITRALTDNDAIQTSWMRRFSERLSRWEELGILDAAWEPGPQRRRTRSGADVVTSTGVLVPSGTAGPIEVHRRELTRTADGWGHLSVVVTLPAELADVPRIGITTVLPGSFDELEWYGDGPHESYADRRSSVTVGRWRSTVTEQYVPYAFPQEHGHHTGLRWLAVSEPRQRSAGPGGVRRAGLLVVADGPLGFSVRHHSDAELFAATHTDELPHDGALTHLSIDAGQRGVGTASCGPDAEPRFQLRAGRHRIGVWLRWFDPRREDPSDLACLVG